MRQTMLTTEDNPFNPFTQSDAWRAFDVRNGYNTEGLIARLCMTSDEESEYDQHLAWEEAIDEVLKYIKVPKYKKVVQEI